MTAVTRRWALQSQLLRAILANDTYQAQCLFHQGVDSDTRFSINSQQRPALCLCAENNALEMVWLLVDQGANVNHCDSTGLTPLHIACKYNYTELARHLLQAHANVHAKTPQGQTPLHMACMQGSLEMINLLISFGSHLDTADADGRTPLHYAAASAKSQVVLMLLAGDADASMQDNNGNTLLHYVASTPFMHLADARQLCRSCPTTIELVNRVTENPLHEVMRSKNSAADDLLLCLLECASRSALDQVNAWGHTPLHVAVLERRSAFVRSVLAAGAVTDTKDDLGHSPLESAVRDGSLETVSLLLSAGVSSFPLFVTGRGSIRMPFSRTSTELVVEVATQDEIENLLQSAAFQPLALSACCRRSLTQHLGSSTVSYAIKIGSPGLVLDFLTFNKIYF